MTTEPEDNKEDTCPWIEEKYEDDSWGSSWDDQPETESPSSWGNSWGD